MFIKSLVTGLGAICIFLAGLWFPGNAQASIVNTFERQSNFIGKSDPVRPHALKSGVYSNGDSPYLLAANRRSSNYRQLNSRSSKSRSYRPNQRTGRRVQSSGSSRQGRRSYSTSFRTRVPTGRSAVGTRKNSFRNRSDIFQRPKSRQRFRSFP